MYRDLIGDPEKFEANGREWWIQQFCHMDGTLKAVRLYDEEGYYVAEFQSEEEATEYARTH